MISPRLKWIAILLAAAFVAADVSVESDGVPGLRVDTGSPAEARVGHPRTPLSYAGVARRTARRTTRRVVRRNEYYRMNVLPAGCIYGPYYGAYYYRCGSYYYVRSGGVYVQVNVY